MSLRYVKKKQSTPYNQILSTELTDSVNTDLNGKRFIILLTLTCRIIVIYLLIQWTDFDSKE